MTVLPLKLRHAIISGFHTIGIIRRCGGLHELRIELPGSQPDRFARPSLGDLFINVGHFVEAGAEDLHAGFGKQLFRGWISCGERLRGR